MRNFFKKVAFVLALAMVLTNIGPAATASAAEAPGLKYSSRVIYVGGSAFGDYTDNCWTPSKNTAGYKVAYEVTTGNSLITVASNGKITATGNGIGKAVVKVTYTPEDGGQATTANFTVKVRRNATDVRLTNATIALVEEALKIGDEVELNAAKSFVGNSYKTGNYGVNNYMKVVSDQIDYKSSDENVIKIEGGKLIAVGNGTATLTVYAYEYLDTSKTPVVYKEYPITVVGGLLAADQTSVTTIKVTMGQSVADAKADDFSVTRISDTVDFGIKSIDISSDGLTVTIETFNNMDDSAEYKVSYDGKEVTFKATDGTVSSMKVNKELIPYYFATVITVDLLDVNDIIIATVKESTASNYNVEWGWNSISGVTDGDKIILYAKNDKAVFTVTYRPGIYVDGIEQGVVQKTFTVTAMDVAVDASIKATISGDPDWPCVYDWLGVTENKTIYAEEDKYLHIYITDPEGNELTQDLFDGYGYYIESSNENVLIVDNYRTHDHTQWSGGRHYIDDVGIYADIHAVKAGSVSILVKNSDGKVVFTIPINVGTARRFVGFDTNNNKTSMTIMNDGLSHEDKVEIIAKDQYGDATWKNYQNYITVDPQGSYANAPEPNTNINWNTGRMDVKFDAATCDPGTYRYKITFEKDNVTATKYVTVIVKAPSGSSSYKIVADNINSAYDGETEKTTGIKVAHYLGGVLYEYLEYDSSVKKEDGSVGIYIDELTITNGKYGTKITSYDGSIETITGAAVGIVSTATSDTAYKSGSVGPETEGITSGYITGDSYTYYGMSKVEANIYGSIDTTTGTVVTKAPNGTRSVKATVKNGDKSITVTGSFTVNDNQEIMTATVIKTSISKSNSTIEDMIKEAITFKHYGYKEINDEAESANIVVRYINSTVSQYDGKSGRYSITGEAKVTVTSVVIGYDRNNKGEYVEYTVPVNRTFTLY